MRRQMVLVGPIKSVLEDYKAAAAGVAGEDVG
jgi:hypothetical protein